MAREDKNTKIAVSDNIGQVQIADDVVAIIAGLAATEVEGVASLPGNVTYDAVAKTGTKKIQKGVKVLITERDVMVDLVLNVAYGHSIVKVSEKVQERVKAAIENMTGLMVSVVNIRIAGVDME